MQTLNTRLLLLALSWLWLSCCCCSTIVTTTSTTSTTTDQPKRSLQTSSSSPSSSSSSSSAFEQIAEYQPYTLVTDAAGIDGDFSAILDQLQKGTDEGTTTAHAIYRDGGHSGSVAFLTLDNPLARNVPKGSRVTGVALRPDNAVSALEGRAFQAWAVGDTSVLVEYSISANQDEYVGCQVGALPEDVRTLDKCFVDSGSITVPDQQLTLEYTYDATFQNINFRSFKRFSLEAKAEMTDCEKEGDCTFPEYSVFQNYYGPYAYGDEIITKALDASDTSQDVINANLDFAQLGEKARAEVAKIAMLNMNLWMWVIRELNYAVNLCENKNCPVDDAFCIETPGMHAWDRAVAFYVGSQQRLANHDGELLYGHSNELCVQFKTCSPKGGTNVGNSYVNHRIFQYFNSGQSMIRQGKCDTARVHKENIVSLMTIPLIQGTLRFAHILAFEPEYSEKDQASAAAYALSILPLVDECNPEAAATIYENLRVQGDSRVDYIEVKRAFEKVYSCLNVTCAQVGGTWSLFTNSYSEEGGPCVEVFGQPVDDDQMALAVGLGVGLGLLAVLAVLVCLIRRSTEKQNQHQSLEVKDATTEVI